MKRIINSKVIVILLMLTVLSMFIVGNSLARYTSNVKAKDSTRVAIFAFDLNGAGVSNKDIELNLFESADNGIDVSEDGTRIIKPLASGCQKLVLRNNGEIALSAHWIILESSSRAIKLPIQYAISNSILTDEDTQWKNSVKQDSSTEELVIVDDSIYKGESDVVRYLHWRWNPNNADDEDTRIGEDAKNYESNVTLQCVVQQVTNKNVFSRE